METTIMVCYSEDKIIDDEIIYSIKKYLKEIITNKVDAIKNNFIKNNINKNCFECTNDILMYSTLSEYTLQMPYFELKFSHLFDEIIIFSSKNNNLDFFYSFKNDNLVDTRNLNLTDNQATEENIRLLKRFYRNDLNRFIISEQYKLCKTPLLFNEFVRFNEFLKDKKSVKVIFESGEDLPCKRDYLTSHVLLEHKYDEFKINSNFDYKQRSLLDVKNFKYRSEIFTFDKSSLNKNVIMEIIQGSDKNEQNIKA